MVNVAATALWEIDMEEKALTFIRRTVENCKLSLNLYERTFYCNEAQRLREVEMLAMWQYILDLMEKASEA